MTKKILMTAALLFAIGAPVLTVAQSEPVQAQAASLIDGQITKVDQEAGKISIKHGPIKKFDMDGMTMVFRAGDPAMLKSVKEGDKVKFDVDRVNGQFTIIKLQKTK